MKSLHYKMPEQIIFASKNKTQILFFSTTLLLGFGQEAVSDHPQFASAKQAEGYSHVADEEDFVSLFDGKSLAGWTTVDNQPVTQGWIVKDGVLIRSANACSIYTAKKYRDFELQFEWRLARGGNSGVKYRTKLYSRGVHGKPEWLGLEYQLWDDKHKATQPKLSTGAIYGVSEPTRKKLLQPIGRFNSAKIVVIGNKIEHWLNGAQILKVDMSSEAWAKQVSNSKFSVVNDIFKNRAGRIQLQDHSSEVGFRSIKIREIRDNVALNPRNPPVVSE